MAETALGMATTLVGGALGVASSAAREEVGLLIGVQDDIWFINDELKMMQAFLTAADGARKNTRVLKAYLEQIRDLAYDIEDCLEEFMIFIKRRSLLQQLFSLGARHRIAIQIRTIKQRVQEVSQRNFRYNLIELTPATSDDAVGDMELTRNLSALYVEEADLFGLQKPKAKLIELITKPKAEIAESIANKAGPKVISIVGMGGLGKTTLAKQVFDSTECSGSFNTRAWVTVSQSFDIKELLREMMKQLGVVLTEEHQGKVGGVEHLIKSLRTGLKEKRYLVVLDDMWTTQAWDDIKLAFPDNCMEESCVVVTTRNGLLAKHCSPEPLIHRPDTLEKEDAKRLLLKKANRCLDGLEKDNMEEIVEKILKKCGGLPLAIVTIGGLLANKDIKEWKSVYDQLPSELESNNPSLEALRRVVSLSYNYLPSYLKPCFLHLSVFPEDFEMKRKYLVVNRWIAEGLIRSGTTRRTLEDVAESYFYELINRSMIQPNKLDILGNVKTCRVHDIVHDIAVSISRQENHVLLVEEHTSTTSAANETIRHISCFASKKLYIGLDFSRVRSFTMFSEPLEPLATLCSSKFKMLRVLDLKNARFVTKQQDINNVGLLIHLKYIHFPDGSYVYAIPRSIGNLRGLQALHMRESSVANLPKEISKLQNLRSIRCSKKGGYGSFDIHDPKECMLASIGLSSCWCCLDGDDRADLIVDLHMALSNRASYSSGVRLPKGMGSLKELQSLEEVDIKRTSSKATKELGELTQLRKLVVTGRGASKKKCKAFCAALQKLSSLRSLRVSAKDVDEPAGPLDLLVSISSPLRVSAWDGDEPGPLDDLLVTSPLRSLRSLRLVGRLQEIPAWVGRSENLVKIHLEDCLLKEVEALAGLPNLMRLRLYRSAYSGEKLVFPSRAFSKLSILYIGYSKELREVAFEESTAPQMKGISIAECDLRSGIHGIKHLQNLKEFSLYRCKVAKLDMLQQEVNKLPNHPLLQTARTESIDDLGDAEESEVMVEATESSTHQATSGDAEESEPAGESSQS